MYVDPVGALAQHTATTVPFKGFVAALLPLANVRSRSPSAPEMASVRRVGSRALRAYASRLAACALLLARQRKKWLAANWAYPFSHSGWPPSAKSVALRRTELASASADCMSRAVECFAACSTVSFFPVLCPIERLTRNALVPRDADVSCLSALCRAIGSATKGSWNRCTAAFAWVGFRFHTPSIRCMPRWRNAVYS
jgi:hypothetical protein